MVLQVPPDAADTLRGMNEPSVTFERAPGLDARDGTATAVQLEKRGRAWLLWSFLLCPCHLPWTLAIVATVFAGSSVGVLVREHVWVAGTLVTAAWVLGTGYGFRLIRRAERAGGACASRPSTRTAATKATSA